jgi:hypothetical protein
MDGMKLGIAETLQKASDASPKDRAKVLRDNDSPVLRDVVRLAYDQLIKWALPEGTPPYKKNDLPDQQPNLYAQWRKMYLFFPGQDINQVRREALFIQLLESLDPADAELLCAIKDKKMPYKKLRKGDFEDAFPGIFDVFKERLKS